MINKLLHQVFIDEHTRYGWVEFFKGKSYKEFSDMLARAETRLRAQHRESAEYRMDKHQGRGRPILKYFSDQASEMVSGQQRARLARLFISLTIVSPSAKLSNGIAERANRTLLDIARSLLVGSGLPIVFWAEAFEMATNIYNRMSHSANPGGKSPYHGVYVLLGNALQHWCFPSLQNLLDILLADVTHLLVESHQSLRRCLRL